MNDRYDVTIIGGGVIGLSCAHYVRRTGASVCVLEKGPFLQGASMENAGLLVPSHIESYAAPGIIAQGLRWLSDPESPFYIKPRVDMELTRWLWGFRAACTKENVARGIPILRDLAFASLELHATLARLPGFENTGLEHKGLFVLHNSKKSERSNLALADAAEKAGLRIERLSKEETLARDPGIRTPMNGSVYFEEDASFDSEKFMTALLAHVKNEGVELIEETDVQGFQNSNGAVTSVQTSAGDIETDHLVLAAGAWSGLLSRKLGFRLPIQPATGYSITVDNPGSELRIPVIITDQKVTITPMPGRMRFGGTLTLVGFDTEIDTRRVRPLQHQVKLYCPEIESGERPMPETWSGFRPCTNDGLPIIGRAEKWKNVIVASGHGMLGMTQHIVSIIQYQHYINLR